MAVVSAPAANSAKKPVRITLRRMRLGLYVLSFLTLALSFTLMILLGKESENASSMQMAKSHFEVKGLHDFYDKAAASANGDVTGEKRDLKVADYQVSYSTGAGEGTQLAQGDMASQQAQREKTQSAPSKTMSSEETEAVPQDPSVLPAVVVEEADGQDADNVANASLVKTETTNPPEAALPDRAIEEKLEEVPKQPVEHEHNETSNSEEEPASHMETKQAADSLSDIIEQLKDKEMPEGQLVGENTEAAADEASQVVQETAGEHSPRNESAQELDVPVQPVVVVDQQADATSNEQAVEEAPSVVEDPSTSAEQNLETAPKIPVEEHVDTSHLQAMQTARETERVDGTPIVEAAPPQAQTEQKGPVQFVLLADTRSGSEWILSQLDQHPAVCASGLVGNGDKIGFPSGALMPEGMPWLSDNDLSKGCTMGFVRDSVLDLLEKSSSSTGDAGSSSWTTPDRCKPDYDASSDPSGVHLPRLCRVVELVQGKQQHFDKNDATAAITAAYMGAFATDDDTILPCHCPSTTTAQGMKVMTDWVFRLPGFLDGQHNVKVIRMHRRNVFARHMSLATSLKTGIWQTHTLAEKLRQLEAIPDDWEIDVDEMLTQFGYMSQQDAEGDAWALEHANGGAEGVLTVDYDNCVDETQECFKKIFQFLGVEDSEKYIAEHAHEFKSTFKGAAETSLLLDRISNSEVVHEALGASTYGLLAGVTDYSEIQHVQVFDKKEAQGAVIRTPSENKGIKTTTVFSGDEDGHKFAAAVSTLKQMPGDTLVVVSMNTNYDGVLTNHHIRSDSKRYSTIVKFRKALREKSTNGAVVVSTASECCVSALTHAAPGDFFQSSTQPAQRKNRACKSGSPDCLWVGDEEASTWRSFMKIIARKSAVSSSGTNLFLDSSIMAGKASDVSKLLDALDVGPAEDERAVLTDYMYHFPDSIVLDYEQSLFGQRFEGAKHVGLKGCFADDVDATHKDPSLIAGSGDSLPLFMYNPKDLGCKAMDVASTVASKKFPKWDGDGIKFEPILNHIDDVLLRNASMEGIDLHFGNEILYIVDGEGIRTSKLERDRYRIKPTDELLLMAHKVLVARKNPRWDALQAAIDNGGLPYFAWYGDFKECGSEAIPLFTTCAVTGCSHGFPSPAYMTIIDAQPDISKWYNVFRDFEKQYPFESKIRKVAWRGALSENDPTKVFSSVRWRLCELVAKRDESASDIFDVGITYVPDYLKHQLENIDVSLVGGLKAGLNPMHAFQRYRAVLDMDGNSWSSRFGTLLCYNSVTIKVEPAYVDYFYYDLEPWKHYIPVKSDLSDLVENVEFATDPQNDAVIKEMIASANQWCAERFVLEELAKDQLDLWNDYVQLMNRADSGWVEQWNEKKVKLLDPGNEYNLVRLN